MTDASPFRPAAPGTHPAYDTPAYGSTRKRHPKQPLVRVPHSLTEIRGPSFLPRHAAPLADLSVVDGREALGERIVVRGRVLDEDGKAVPGTMIELWQANAAGR